MTQKDGQETTQWLDPGMTQKDRQGTSQWLEASHDTDRQLHMTQKDRNASMAGGFTRHRKTGNVSMAGGFT